MPCGAASNDRVALGASNDGLTQPRPHSDTKGAHASLAGGVVADVEPSPKTNHLVVEQRSQPLFSHVADAGLEEARPHGSIGLDHRAGPRCVAPDLGEGAATLVGAIVAGQLAKSFATFCDAAALEGFGMTDKGFFDHPFELV